MYSRGVHCTSIRAGLPRITKEKIINEVISWSYEPMNGVIYRIMDGVIIIVVMSGVMIHI